VKPVVNKPNRKAHNTKCYPGFVVSYDTRPRNEIAYLEPTRESVTINEAYLSSYEIH